MCNLYITQESDKTLSDSFTNIKSFFILDVEDIISEINPRTSSYRYFCNKIIEDLLKEKSESKKIKGIIYRHKNLNETLILALKNKIETIPTIESLIIIDNSISLKLKRFYGLVDEVFFFQKWKKLKIL